MGAAALALLAGPAAAVTVKNTSKAEVSIGIDWGNKEKAEKIPAGKSVSFECKDGCGVTGPWAFSWMAKGDDTITTDGKSLVTVGKPMEQAE
jgi:mevalonate pyrophosphate decarboxylase